MPEWIPVVLSDGELWLESPLTKESRPVGLLWIELRVAADPVVLLPTKVCGCRLVEQGKLLAHSYPACVRRGTKLNCLKDEERMRSVRSLGDYSGHAYGLCSSDLVEGLRLGSKNSFCAGCIALREEAPLSVVNDKALVYAATGEGLSLLDREFAAGGFLDALLDRSFQRGIHGL